MPDGISSTPPPRPPPPPVLPKPKDSPAGIAEALSEKRKAESARQANMPPPRAAPDVQEPFSFSSRGTPISLAQKTRNAARTLWGNIKMGIRNKSKVTQEYLSPRIAQGKVACSTAFSNLSKTFAQWSSTISSLASEAKEEIKESALTAVHTIDKGLKAFSNPPVKYAEPIQNPATEALARWKTVRKLENIDQVLKECQTGKKKPKVENGKLIAVDRALVSSGKTGHSEESREAIAFINTTIRAGADLHITTWDQGGKHYNLSDITTQFRSASKALEWNKTHKLMDDVLEGLQDHVDEVVGEAETRAAVIERLKNISKVLQTCIDENKKPRLDKDANLTAVERKKPAKHLKAGKTGESAKTKSAILYIADQIKHAADLDIDQWSEDGKTVNLNDLLDSYKTLGEQREWTKANPNFLPAIEAIRSRVLQSTSKVGEAPLAADSSGIRSSYTMGEIVEEVSTGNSRLAYLMMSAHRVNPGTASLIQHIQDEFIDLADHSNIYLDREERALRMTNLLQFCKNYLELGTSIPPDASQRDILRTQMEKIAQQGRINGLENEHYVLGEELQELIDSKLHIAPRLTSAQVEQEMLANAAIRPGDSEVKPIANAANLKRQVERELARLAAKGENISDYDKNEKEAYEKQLIELNAILAEAAKSPPRYDFVNKPMKKVYADLENIITTAFSKIPVSEFDYVTEVKKGHEVFPNVSEAAETFNAINDFVVELLLHCEPDEREAIASKVIDLCDRAIEKKNFGLAMALFSVLEAASVHRLIKGQLADSASAQQIKEFLSPSGSYKNLRVNIEEAIFSEEPGVVPYWGVYQTDCTFIQEGNPNYLKDADGKNTDQIAMAKLQFQTGIKELVLFTQNSLAPKVGKSHPDVDNLAAHLVLMPYLKQSDNQRYERSLAILPRK